LPNLRPTRATAAGRAYLDLQNLARRQGRATDELHQLYALEGFLSRLVVSDYADRFALKGGVLLAAFQNRRPTRDVDLFARDLSNAPDKMLICMQAIAATPVDDGLVLNPGSATAGLIRDEDDYAGVRVTLTGSLSVARLRFHIDINVGDAVDPPPGPVTLPRLLGGDLIVTGYPLAMVHAEKIVTMIQRRDANTRWRDFADVYTLSHSHSIGGTQLHSSLLTVAAHRQAPMIPLSRALRGMAVAAQPKWAAWRRKQRMEHLIPELFADVVNHVIAFGDPAIKGDANGLTWDLVSQTWGDYDRSEP
jgi:hypothetical protein